MGSSRLITRRRVAGLLVAVVAALFGLYILVLPLVDPLRRSDDAIAAELLELAPPGTSREEVQTLVSERGWSDGGIVGAGRPGDLQVVLGTYQGIPFLVNVFAHWEFDERGRLLTVRVSKFPADAP